MPIHLCINAILFAQRRQWPDAVDMTIMGFAGFGLVGVILLGHWCGICDIRAYYRALRGALVLISYYFPTLPEWARYETPGSLKIMGLEWPCTEVDVKEAYRKLAEQCHPDRGGDPQEFHALQRNFEVAMNFVKSNVEDKL